MLSVSVQTLLHVAYDTYSIILRAIERMFLDFSPYGLEMNYAKMAMDNLYLKETKCS